MVKIWVTLPTSNDNTDSANKKILSTTSTTIFRTPEENQHDFLLRQMTDLNVSPAAPVTTTSNFYAQMPVTTNMPNISPLHPAPIPQPVYWIDTRGQVLPAMATPVDSVPPNLIVSNNVPSSVMPVGQQIIHNVIQSAPTVTSMPPNLISNTNVVSSSYASWAT